jgi:3'-5' exoribonuclease
MPPLDLTRAAVGDRVHHELLVLDRLERATQLGDPYLVLSLGNGSGAIDTAPIWSDHLDWADGAEPGRIVQVIGAVTAWSGSRGAPKRQLTLSGPLRVLPVEHYDVEQFLPRIAADPVKLWDAVDEWRAKLSSRALRLAVDSCFADDEFRVRFERWPASVDGHHARLGGLLLHTCEVTRIAQQLARTLRGAHTELVVAGALLHDIGQLDAIAIEPRGFTMTTAGALVGPLVLGARMLERRLHTLRAGSLLPTQHDELLHLVLAHRVHANAGSPVRPATVEAELVASADQTAIRGTELLEAFADPETFGGSSVPSADGDLSARAPRRVGHRLWRRPHGWD